MTEFKYAYTLDGYCITVFEAGRPIFVILDKSQEPHISYESYGACIIHKLCEGGFSFTHPNGDRGIAMPNTLWHGIYQGQWDEEFGDGPIIGYTLEDIKKIVQSADTEHPTMRDTGSEAKERFLTTLRTVCKFK